MGEGIGRISDLENGQLMVGESRTATARIPVELISALCPSTLYPLPGVADNLDKKRQLFGSELIRSETHIGKTNILLMNF